MSAGRMYHWEGDPTGIGIASMNLLGEGQIQLKIGNEQKIYFVSKSEAREIAKKYNSYYTAGRTSLSVIPKWAFKVEEENGGLV